MHRETDQKECNIMAPSIQGVIAANEYHMLQYAFD